MDYWHRSILRHGGVSIALLILPLAFMERSDAWLWYTTHAEFLTGLLTLGLAMALLAWQAWQRRIPLQWIADAHTIAHPREQSYWQRLWITWASCARCMAFWFGTASGIGFTLLFWPIPAETMWALVLRTMYFAMICASAAAAVGTGFQIAYSNSDDSPD